MFSHLFLFLDAAKFELFFCFFYTLGGHEGEAPSKFDGPCEHAEASAFLFSSRRNKTNTPPAQLLPHTFPERPATKESCLIDEKRGNGMGMANGFLVFLWFCCSFFSTLLLYSKPNFERMQRVWLPRIPPVRCEGLLLTALRSCPGLGTQLASFLSRLCPALGAPDRARALVCRFHRRSDSRMRPRAMWVGSTCQRS